MADKLLFFDDETPEQALERRLARQALGDDKRERSRARRRWVRPSDWLMHLLTLIFALLCAVYVGVLFERFTPAGAVRHLSALLICNPGPAARGEIGYWPVRDLDRDGVACER